MRNVKTLILAGLFAIVALSSDASANHKNKCGPAPVAPCAPAKVKHHGKMGCHKKATAVVVAPTCSPCYPTTYPAAPAYAPPYASGQRM